MSLSASSPIDFPRIRDGVIRDQRPNLGEGTDNPRPKNGCSILGCRVDANGKPWCRVHVSHSPYARIVRGRLSSRSRELAAARRGRRADPLGSMAQDVLGRVIEFGPIGPRQLAWLIGLKGGAKDSTAVMAFVRALERVGYVETYVDLETTKKGRLVVKATVDPSEAPDPPW